MTSLDKLTEIPYVTESHVDAFKEAGFEELEDLVDLTERDLDYIDGVGPSKLNQIYQLLDREGIERAEKDENYEKFRGLLEELFQFESADLDFGIYRIMNARRDRIEAFLDEELEEKVKEELEEFKNIEQGDVQQSLEEAKEDIQENFPQWTDENGEVDEDEIPEDAQGIAQEHKERYLAAKKELEKAEIGEKTEAAIYQDLYRFFKRYYKDGDFIPQRRAANQEKYAIPYNGEEVKLHWANKDQYFVKTGEHFKDYKFDKDSYEIEFKLHDAHVEKNNKKGDEKYFVLREEDPVEQDERFLTVHFEYRPLTEEDFEKYDLSDSSQSSTYKKEIRKNTEENILSEVSNELEGTLNQEVDNPRSESTVLQKHLKNYRKKNENDYFIHKDLGGFLEQELDFYLKNEVFSWKEMTENNGEMPVHVRARLNAIENIAQEIINFVAEIEDFQKKLFEKKKFVVNTEYCITLDKVPEELYSEILDNEKQIEEWKELYALEEQEDQGLDEDFLTQNQSMMVDTKHFGEEFKYKVISSFESLDSAINGSVFKGENFQLLNLLDQKYDERISLTYIDPPYNTGNDFPYKDNYQHSSWLSLLGDRLDKNKSLLSDDGAVFTSIDDEERSRLDLLMEEIYGENNFIANIVWKKKYNGNNMGHIPPVHDHILAYGKDLSQDTIHELPLPEEYIEKNYQNPDDDPRGPWTTTDLSANHEGPHFAIENPETGEEFTPPEGRYWVFNKDEMEKRIEEGQIIFGKSGEGRPVQKKYLSEMSNTRKAETWWENKGYNADATTEIRDMLSAEAFMHPKPAELLKNIVRVGSGDEDIVMDFFAGSGTLAEAVIRLESEEETSRNYILGEMADYFESLLIPRIKKSVYSTDWEDGVPKSESHTSHMIKYQKLEQYEDALNNLDAGDDQAGVEEFTSNTLEYFLNFEVDGSSLLDLDGLKSPFSYEMEIREGDEAKKKAIDLVETFNYLLGLEVESIQRHEKFDREYRIVKGRKDDEEVTVVWRPVSEDDSKEFYEDEREFLNSEVLGDEDTVYINHDSVLEAKPIEKTFQERMWE